MQTLKPPIAPMEATTAADIPQGAGWQYEPKWDGFRCLAFRDEKTIYLQSKAEKPLARYFPEVVDALSRVKLKSFVLDGELVVPIKGSLDFDQLLQRIHPAATRIQKLSTEHPAHYIVFDLLADAKSSFMQQPLSERRARLEYLAQRFFTADSTVHLSVASTKLSQAKRWYETVGGDLDGIIAKRLDASYHPGERDAMIKVKNYRSVDCVVGGFRYGTNSKLAGSLLLGLYDEQGLLHHVGFTSAIADVERKPLTAKLEKLIQKPGFTGRAPGGPSRWSTERSSEWKPLKPKLVVEVTYDHFSGDRFRHGTALLRWRPDKSPEQCTFQQLVSKGRNRDKLGRLIV